MTPRDVASQIRRAYPGADGHALETADMLDRMQSLIETLLDNDPMEYVANGGVTVLDVWRKDAAHIVRPNL